MKTYRIFLNLKSACITPFHSDTIFGSLCWAWRYLKGEEYLVSFLNEYKNSKPPLLVSSGFPLGFLPRPILPDLTFAQFKEVLAQKSKDELTEMEISYHMKKFKKIEIIPETFYQNHPGGFSEEDIIKEYLDRTIDSYPSWHSQISYHNALNRLTEKPLAEGGLYFQEESVLDYEKENSTSDFDTKQKNVIQVFLKGDYFSTKEISEVFQFISFSGFGKNKSTGNGRVGIDQIEEYNLPHSSSPNAFLSLSAFVPAEKDPPGGFYHSMVKYGKLGGDFAKPGLPQYRLNPFKKPLLMLEPGSLFFCNSLSEYYGSLIENIHLDPKIKHYAYAFPLGVRINEKV